MRRYSFPCLGGVPKSEVRMFMTVDSIVSLASEEMALCGLLVTTGRRAIHFAAGVTVDDLAKSGRRH